ncbi:RNA polymerase sigma factor SigM [Actinopolymorpha alba]|uniref:RNA polymerase sigma factor SigM n=1 Tax=Actinopolymorpha alba TaxID=533267 RepID=UPI000367B30C|nr:RNA polymerase sigma factor SigM [Actinopolymorpha alba]
MTVSTPSSLGEGSSAPTDKDLIARHVAGDPDAFAELFRRHRDRLWAVALRTLSDPEEAADALQDALVSAFRNAAQFRGESAVTTWLHRVVVNACLDRVRRRTVRAAEPLPEDDRAAELAAVRPPDPAEAQELRIDIMTALDTLNADQRAAIVLVDMEGYSVEEAAQILDCAPGTIKSRCARGRAKLAPLLVHLRSAATKSAGDGDSGGNHSVSPSVQGVPRADPGHDPPRSPASTSRGRQTRDRQGGEAP